MNWLLFMTSDRAGVCLVKVAYQCTTPAISKLPVQPNHSLTDLDAAGDLAYALIL